MREYGFSKKKISRMWWLEQDLYIHWALYMKIKEGGGDPDTPVKPKTVVVSGTGRSTSLNLNQNIDNKSLEKLAKKTQSKQADLDSAISRLQQKPTS